MDSGDEDEQLRATEQRGQNVETGGAHRPRKSGASVAASVQRDFLFALHAPGRQADLRRGQLTRRVVFGTHEKETCGSSMPKGDLLPEQSLTNQWPSTRRRELVLVRTSASCLYPQQLSTTLTTI